MKEIGQPLHEVLLIGHVFKDSGVDVQGSNSEGVSKEEGSDDAEHGKGDRHDMQRKTQDNPGLHAQQAAAHMQATRH